jgi:hypothetical protein
MEVGNIDKFVGSSGWGEDSRGKFLDAFVKIRRSGEFFNVPVKIGGSGKFGKLIVEFLGKSIEYIGEEMGEDVWIEICGV